ncbi:MAG TPA: adenylate/guanylate cyclase domain-containing protein [Gaiellaceae bacterium]|nr:adenylate/guanylate cyclase domain-containing protein [Gaiellaceae bacterium]
MTACPSCGQENPAGARFCNACGTTLPTGPAPLPEERRIVTVLFVDLVGFTARSERLDPEDVRAILTPYFNRVRTEVETRGGTVEKFIGDAVMAVFGAPVAHGDDPERAVRAAVAVCAALEELNAADPELELQLRVAVNTGEALFTRAAAGEGMVAGDVVNTAARLQTAAPVNGILVGEETYRATRTVIQYAEAEPVVAKGKQQPVRAWRALAALSAPGERAQTAVPMLGRASELAALEGIWERVVSERRPQLVTLFGPAGIGKTRLTAEFTDLVRERGATVIRGRSLPYGEVTPYGAFAAQVKQVAGMFDTDPVDAAWSKLESRMRELVDGEGEEIASHIAMLIGVGREGGVGDRQTLFFSARRLVEALAREQPTVLVFEDIHLSSASMLDLLETLASRVRDVPLLLLTQARPELLAERSAWGGGLPAYTALPLEPLAREHAEELAGRLLEAAGASARIAEGLAGTAEGNPLFIEELAVSVAERTTDDAELPSSVRSIIAARLDALPQAERDTLLDASAVGKVFWSGAVARMAADGASRLEALDSLEWRDLIRRDPVSRLQGQHQFAFKHQLIYEVAYATLPRGLRRERHRVIAEFLEEAVPETGDVAPALAQHWREAGEPERAIGYLLAGAEQASRGWAKDEAVRLYGQALELLSADDPRRREVAKQFAVAAQAAYHIIDAQRLARHTPAED